MIPYYQWVPLALLIQALLFYMPYLVWRTLSGQSGIYIGNLVECGQTLAELDMTHSRDRMLQYMTRQMDR
jgi:innexin